MPVTEAAPAPLDRLRALLRRTGLSLALGCAALALFALVVLPLAPSLQSAAAALASSEEGRATAGVLLVGALQTAAALLVALLAGLLAELPAAVGVAAGLFAGAAPLVVLLVAQGMPPLAPWPLGAARALALLLPAAAGGAGVAWGRRWARRARRTS